MSNDVKVTYKPRANAKSEQTKDSSKAQRRDRSTNKPAREHRAGDGDARSVYANSKPRRDRNEPRAERASARRDKPNRSRDDQGTESTASVWHKPIKLKPVRAVAADVVYQVVDQGRSLSDVLPKAQVSVKDGDQGLLAEMCYGVIRQLPKLEYLTRQLLTQPLVGDSRVFQFLLYVGLYQLTAMRVPSHAAVAETVNACQAMQAPGFKALVNAVMRRFLREQEQLLADAEQQPVCQHLHPGWILKKLQQAYPEHWQQVIDAGNQKAPMWLRVNGRHQSAPRYRELLETQGLAVTDQRSPEHGLCLASPVDVAALPGFADGWVSVQDGAAQYAGQLLPLNAGDKVLDACAAPGGKSCHLLERADVALTALEIDPYRVPRITENLDRLQLSAQVKCGDASVPSEWWDGQAFNKILADVPCSATGVIRRHPDIKWLRKAADIAPLVELQARILDALWSTLAVGGQMLYATCSILPEENSEQIAAFLARHTDAKLCPLSVPSGLVTVSHGWQILPGEHNMDGFYYALLEKQR